MGCVASGCRTCSHRQRLRPLRRVRTGGENAGGREPFKAKGDTDRVSRSATHEADAERLAEERLVAVDRGEGDAMSVEWADELALQLLQLLQDPGATTRWQKEGVGGRSKTTADPKSAKGFDEDPLDHRRLIVHNAAGTQQHEFGHVKC